MRKLPASALLVLAVTIALAGCMDTVISPDVNSIPRAAILSPEDGLTVVEGDSIHFIGTASDGEDGELAGAALTWTSDIDGAIGTGRAFFCDNLSVNAHRITLTATDSNGRADSASVTVHVEEDPFVRVLFIGSSHFSYNSLHMIFRNLAEAAGKQVITDAYTVGGAFLEYHSKNPATLEKINSQKWDFVLLQGSAAVIAFPATHDEIFYPRDFHALRKPLMDLKAQVEANNPDAMTVWMMNWAYEDGLTYIEGRDEDYFDMQQLIYDNTLSFADEIGLVIAPAGWAWREIMLSDPGLHYLFQSDWSHPSVRGSYLTACVIYSTLFMEDLRGVPYYADIPEFEAMRFQFTASLIVTRNFELWNRL